MNKLNLPASDFALTSSALAFMQTSYEYLENIAKIAGQNVLISGGTVNGGVADAGIIYINGKLMPFSGGALQTNVRIIETSNIITVGTGQRTQITYYAEFGTSTDPSKNVPWANIKKINTIVDLMANIEWVQLLAPNNSSGLTYDMSNAYVGFGGKGLVRFKGYVTIGGDNSGVPFMDLLNVPAAFAPDRDVPLTAYTSDEVGAIVNPYTFQLSSNGTTFGYTTYGQVYLDQMSYVKQ